MRHDLDESNHGGDQDVHTVQSAAGDYLVRTPRRGRSNQRQTPLPTMTVDEIRARQQTMFDRGAEPSGRIISSRTGGDRRTQARPAAKTRLGYGDLTVFDGTQHTRYDEACTNCGTVHPAGSIRLTPATAGALRAGTWICQDCWKAGRQCANCHTTIWRNPIMNSNGVLVHGDRCPTKKT